MNAVVVNGIAKSYGKGKSRVQALQKISFEAQQGELFGIIGPDGAGKTSLFRILTTLILPDEGQATVAGYDVVTGMNEIRKRVGYMPGKFSLYPDLSVEENLSFFATLFSTTIEQNYDLIRSIYVQIEKFKTRRAGALSGGMKQKLALCCALIHRPEILFLDEPTTGVDAVSRKEFWELLRELQSQKITIIVSTPYMDEANLCDRVALIQTGTLLDIDTPKGITKKFPHPLWAVAGDNIYEVMLELRKLPYTESCYPFGQALHVVFSDPGVHLEMARKQLESAGFRNTTFTRIEAGIEDSFMELMGTHQHD